MAFVKMKDKDGNIISVNENYIDKYKAQGYTTDLNKPLDYDKLSPNSIYRKENAQYVGDAYVPQEKINKGGTIQTVGSAYDITAQMQKLAELQKQQAIAGLAKVRDSQLSNLAQERAQIKPMYYNSRNQASTASQLAARNFAEYMAQRGQTKSGATAQAELNRQGTLQSNINALNLAENQAYQDIARRQSDVKNAYDSDVAAAEAGIQAQALQNRIAEMQRQQEIAREEARHMNELARQNELLQYNRSQDALQREIDTIGAYYDNFQAEINRRQATPDKSDDDLIPYLQAARQQKIREQQQLEMQQQAAEQAAQEKAAQQAFENYLKQQELELKKKQTNYNTSKPYYAPKTSSGSSLTANQQLQQQNKSAIANMTNWIYDVRTPQEALNRARQNKSKILSQLIEAGYSGNEALEYYNGIIADLESQI